MKTDHEKLKDRVTRLEKAVALLQLEVKAARHEARLAKNGVYGPVKPELPEFLFSDDYE